METRGLTQVDVGELLDIDRNSVWRKLAGDRQWNLTELETLAAEWHIPLSTLVPDEVTS